MRVVDASVIPLTTGVAIQSTVYAIAEKVRPDLQIFDFTRSDSGSILVRRQTYSEKSGVWNRHVLSMGRFRVPISRNHCIRIPLKGYLRMNQNILVPLFVALPVVPDKSGSVRCMNGFFIEKLDQHAVTAVYCSLQLASSVSSHFLSIAQTWA